MIDLKGKIALVTGAASGIGLEVSSLFIGLGATVYMADRDEDGVRDAASRLGGRAMCLDVTSESEWQEACKAIEDECGKLDILVNNAGIMLSCPFAKAGIDVLRRQNAVNVEGVYLGMHTALPLLLKAADGGQASVVNVSSIYGKVGGREYAAYSATKGAVRALSKAVAIELAAKRVRVNCVMPGPVATNLSAEWDAPRDDAGRLLTAEEALAAWTSLIPAGRLAMASDIAPLIAFLASDAAGFVTGSEYIIDGGYTAA